MELAQFVTGLGLHLISAQRVPISLIINWSLTIPIN